MAGNLQKYDYGYDPNAFEYEEEEEKKGFVTPRVTISEGQTILRVLPPPPDGWIPGKPRSPLVIAHEHWQDRPGGQRVRYACPRAHLGERCPSCEKAERLQKSRNPLDKDQAKKVQPQKRYYTNVIDRAQPERGPLYWSFGWQIKDALTKLAKNPVWGDYCHAMRGYDIIVMREGAKQQDTRYTIQPTPNRTQIDPEWMGQLYDLSEFVTCLSYDEIIQLVVTGVGGRSSGRQVGSSRSEQELFGQPSGAAGSAGRVGLPAHDDAEDVVPFGEDGDDIPI